MYAKCPECEAVFPVSKIDLKSADGLLYCEHCESEFPAKGHLYKKPPAPITPLNTTDEDALDEDTLPEALKAEKGTSWVSLFLWTVVALLLVAVLVGQYFWFMQRDMVLQHPTVRPLLTDACTLIGCRLPETRDPAAFRIENHVVRSHPELGQALQFDATFVNTAAFAQPYPVLKLTFENLAGSPIAQRYFKPNEYLNLPNIEQQTVPSGGAVHAQIELLDLDAGEDGEKLLQGYQVGFF